MRDLLRNRFDGDALLYHALLSVVLFAYAAPVYVGILFFGTLPFRDTRLGFAPSWLLNLIALLVLLATAGPVWRWARLRVHHVVYAQDEASVDMIEQLNASLDIGRSQSSVLAAVAETIARTIKLPYAALETAAGDAASYGTPLKGGTRTRVELRYRGEPVGWLEVMARLPDEPLTVGEYRLLSSLARQAEITLYAAQLGDALQASRAQLVTAREEERRRMRRDLHDGLGPTLAALRLQLSALRHTVRQNPERAEALIDELRDDVRAATAEIRRLVYDLRPPMLDELGLLGALRNLGPADNGLEHSLEAPTALPPLPAALEVALYRIAAEALHNTARHAQATQCALRLQVRDGALTLTVTDNGRGLPPSYLAGVGHVSMGERAAELGGVVSFGPAPEHGTCVTAIFPLKG
jgi:signal transduction histidine kinase